MSRLKIHNSTKLDQSDPFYADGFTAWGTQVFLDGQEVRSCRGVDLHVDVDDPVRATVNVIATDELDVEVDASVTLNVSVADEHHEVHETPLPGGGRRIRIVRREVKA